MYDSFFHCIQQEDQEYISQSYEAISRLEKGYGTIKYKFAVGQNAVKVLDKLLSVSISYLIYNSQFIRKAPSSVHHTHIQIPHFMMDMMQMLKVEKLMQYFS